MGGSQSCGHPARCLRLRRRGRGRAPIADGVGGQALLGRLGRSALAVSGRGGTRGEGASTERTRLGGGALTAARRTGCSARPMVSRCGRRGRAAEVAIEAAAVDVAIASPSSGLRRLLPRVPAPAVEASAHVHVQHARLAIGGRAGSIGGVAVRVSITC